MTRARIALSFVAVAFLVFGNQAADAQVPALGAQAISLPGSAAYGYATPVVLAVKSLPISYTNLDIAQHDFVQDVRADGFSGPKNRPWCKKFSKGKCPVFWSVLAGIGQTVPVQGLSAVKPGGRYSFYCTIHIGMTGKLIFLN